jgi:MGT family glycosyltransferase
MSHFGIICPPISGHVDPFAALGRTLLTRGHRVTVFHVNDLRTKAQLEGLEFCTIGGEHFPPGTLRESVAKLATLKGLASLRYAIECECRISNLILEYGPREVRQAGIDVLLVDQNEPAGATVAEHLELPFVSVCTSLPLNREPLIPPPFVGWSYTGSYLGRLRNRIGYAVANRFIAPIQTTLNRYRKSWNLPVLRSPDDSFSRIAQIAQMPREFDFPRESLPSVFHYVGPLFDERSLRVSFPFEKLDGRPLVYGSLGTLQSTSHEFFQIMAEACSGCDVQLVLSLGDADAEEVPRLAGNPLVVGYAPQIELLSRAAVTITHSGMNTTQQSLYFGVPMVAIPLTHDQPAIAARLGRSGAGIVIPPRRLTPARLRSALRSILAVNSTYQQRAQDLRTASRSAGGVHRAASIVEDVAATRSLHGQATALGGCSS